MSTITMTNLSPAKWRTLNALFLWGFPGGNELGVDRLIQDQDVTRDVLIDLEKRVMIVAQVWGDLGGMLVDICDLTPQGIQRATVRLTTAGRRKVVTSPANNVICMLAGRSDSTATAKAVRTEGDVDDETLRGMEQEGLIEGNLPLSSFRKIPPTLQIKVTRKGRQYYPR